MGRHKNKKLDIEEQDPATIERTLKIVRRHIPHRESAGYKHENLGREWNKKAQMSNGFSTWWRKALTLKEAYQGAKEYLLEKGVQALVWAVDINNSDYGNSRGRDGKRTGGKVWRIGQNDAAYSMMARDRTGMYEVLNGHEIGVMYYDVDLSVAAKGHTNTDFQIKVNEAKKRTMTMTMTITMATAQREEMTCIPYFRS